MIMMQQLEKSISSDNDAVIRGSISSDNDDEKIRD